MFPRLDFRVSKGRAIKRIRFHEFQPVSEVDFERLYLSGGYGIQVGYLSRYGFPYFDFVPSLTYTRIEYETQAVRGELSRWSVQYALEFGYQYFFTDHVVGKIFSRGLGEDSQLWNSAISHAAGSAIYAESVNSNYAGIAIGWHIPERLARPKSWTIR
jgi:hypothetical protein